MTVMVEWVSVYREQLGSGSSAWMWTSAIPLPRPAEQQRRHYNTENSKNLTDEELRRLSLFISLLPMAPFTPDLSSQEVCP